MIQNVTHPCLFAKMFRSVKLNLIVVIAVVFIIGVKMDVLKLTGRMNFQATNLDEAWRKWEQLFHMYFNTCEIAKKVNDVQVALLLHAAAPEAHRKSTHRFHLWRLRPRIIVKPFWTNLGLIVNQGKTLYSTDTGSGMENRPRVRQWTIESKIWNLGRVHVNFGDQENSSW